MTTIQSDPLRPDFGPRILCALGSGIGRKTRSEPRLFQQAQGTGGHGLVIVRGKKQARVLIFDDIRNAAGVARNYGKS